MRARKVAVLGFALLLAAAVSGVGGFFESPVFAAANCQGVRHCSTLADCPCPTAGQCGCINSPSCGRICICVTTCFGGDPP